MAKKKKLFHGQKDDETVVAFFHKHWFSFVGQITYFCLMLVGSLVLLFLWIKLEFDFLLYIGFVLAIVAVTYVVYNYMMWWWDVYILTSRRVIDINQKSLFHRVVSEADLKNIQDTNYEVNGFWATLFNYGNVVILTASSTQSLRFEDVANPHDVQEMIVKVKDGKICVN